MKTTCSMCAGVLVLGLLAGGCGDRSQNPESSSATPSTPTKVLARTLDKAQLNTALLNAIKAKDAARVQDLLSQGADARTKTQWGKPALHLACETGNLEIVQALLGHGADLYAQIATKYSDDGAGYDGAMAGSPLTYAASGGHADIVRLLLDQGAGVDTPTLEGRTALMYAVSAELPTNGHVECVRLLIEHGANVNAPVPQSRGILTLAGTFSYLAFQTNEIAAQRQIIETLTQSGARR